MKEPMLVLNWGAMAAAMVAAFFFGFLWYTPLFGKTWAKAMAFKMDRPPTGAEMGKSLTIQVIGLFLTVYVIAHTGQIWRPSVWGLGPDLGADWMWGFFCGFFTWL